MKRPDVSAGPFLISALRAPPRSKSKALKMYTKPDPEKQENFLKNSQNYSVADQVREAFDRGEIDLFIPQLYQPVPALEELARRRQWVCWKYVSRGEGKPTKVPVDPKTGRNASSTDPTTWRTYWEARNRYAASKRANDRNIAGIGYVLSEDDDYTGIDLDECIDDDGNFKPWVDELLTNAATYAELSPSERGIRMFVRGKIEKSRKCDAEGIEIYRSERYLTITDDPILRTPGEINEDQDTLATLLARIEAARPNEAVTYDEGNHQKPQASPRVSGGDVSRGNRSSDAGANAWAKVALEKRAERLAGTGEGGRNTALNATAYGMGRIVARGWIDESTVRAALEDACKKNGVWKEDGPKQCRQSLSSGLSKGKQNPRPDLPEREEDREIKLLADDIGRRVDEAYASRKIEEAEDGTLYDAETGEIVEGPSGAPSKRESASKEPDIKPTPYEWLDPSSIPPREWLYGQHYIRSFIGVTGAAGGVGKSQLTIAEALSMVSGRALLCGTEPTEILNVWIWNGEDPLHELNRRVAGTAKHYGIKREDCRGQLFVDSGRNTKIVIAKAEKGGLVIARPLVEALKQRLAEDKIDVLIIDPFVKSHRVSENDNTLIDAVASEWADIAEQTNCAIELVHHVRKIGDVEVTVEAMRGASALVSAARSARVLNPMTDDEAKKAGVDNRRAYFRVNNGKSNMAPSSENATWFHLQSVDLQNRGPYEDGDSVGVVTDWKWPDPTEGVTVHDLRAAQAAIADGQWREDVRAKNWAGLAVADAIGLDPDDKQAKEKIKGLLKIWIKNGALVVVDGKDEASRTRKFVMCGRDADDETFDPSAY